MSDDSILHKVPSGQFCGLNCADNSAYHNLSTHHEMQSIVIIVTVINTVIIVMIINLVFAIVISV